MGPAEQRGAEIVKGMTGRSRGPGFEEGVLPVPVGAPPATVCLLGPRPLVMGCLGAATWTLPAVLPVSVHAQEMNIFLLLFWASSQGGWAGGRRGGPWAEHCCP